MASSKEPLLPWNDLPEGQIVQYESNLWVVRTGVVVNRPKRVKKYEDSNLVLSQLYGDSNSTLGYTLTTKRAFDKVFEKGTFVSFLSRVEHHHSPEFKYKDPKVHLLSFNDKANPSYWFLVRYRPS